MRYKDAGVDIDAASKAKARIKQLARSTFSPRVLREVGAFGGFFSLQGLPRDAVLVSSVDGVGTKLKLAFALNRHDTVGADLVNHCVNDIAVHGAAPLFFLDYLATGKMHPKVVTEVVKGLAGACRKVGCALVGGETAEMPGFYPDNEYDLAGCIVGWVKRSRIIDGSGIRPGDAILGLPSLGLHTNGYSLARKVLLEQEGMSLTEARRGTRPDAGRRVAGAPSLLLARGRAASGAGLAERLSSHHRRRHYGQHSAHPVQRRARGSHTRKLARAAHLRPDRQARQRAATTT